MKKVCDFTNENVEFYQKIREEKNLPSDMAAIKYILEEYAMMREEEEQFERIADLVSIKMIEHYKREIIGILHSSRKAEKNTDILLDVMNTILFKDAIKNVILKDEVVAPVIQVSEKHHRKKIEKQQQRKLFRKGK